MIHKEVRLDEQYDGWYVKKLSDSLAEATALLERCRDASQWHHIPQHELCDFLSRAPAQPAAPEPSRFQGQPPFDQYPERAAAPEPSADPMLKHGGFACESDCESTRCPAKHPAHIRAEKRAESAEAQLAKRDALLLQADAELADLEGVMNDRDEWREQHENLLAMYRRAEAQLAAVREIVSLTDTESRLQNGVDGALRLRKAIRARGFDSIRVLLSTPSPSDAKETTNERPDLQRDPSRSVGIRWC